MPTIEKTEMTVNAAGRTVPEIVNGRPQTAYMGVGKYQPIGHTQRRLQSFTRHLLPRRQNSKRLARSSTRLTRHKPRALVS